MVAKPKSLKAPVFQSRYNRVLLPGIKIEGPSRTKQSDAEAADINNIMKKYELTGQLPDMIKNQPQYGDFAISTDYQDSLNTVIKAETQFEALSAVVRKRFGNSPTNFLEFVNNPDENLQEMIDLGLAQKVSKDTEPKPDPDPKPTPKKPD